MKGQLVSWRPLDICGILCGIVVVRVAGLVRARLMTTQRLRKTFLYNCDKRRFKDDAFNQWSYVCETSLFLTDLAFEIN